MSLVDRLPEEIDADPDAIFDAFVEWNSERGLTLYPAQEEALIEVVSGNNLILATPTTTCPS
ncbi:hypothetical protein ACWCSH_03945, partial [Streptosporangium sp. NPDC001682]